MITLADLFPPHPEEGYTDEALGRMAQRLVSAYGATFSGKGTAEDADLVLVDLAQFTRYMDTTPLTASAEVAKALDQRRAVFVRIAEGITRSGRDLDGLHRAVLTSPPISEET